MPEWPDLRVLRRRLERALVGHRIEAVSLGDPVVIRAARPLEELLTGRAFGAVRQRGKHLLFDLDADVLIVVNPMLSGLFEVRPRESKAARDTRLRIALDDGTELRYRDDTRMGKVYVLRGEAPAVAVPGFAELGPEPDEVGDLAARLVRRGGHVRNALQDQRIVAGIGNAYADEILWEARLHPDRQIRSLDGDELARLEGAMGVVLARALDEVDAGMPPELGTKPRSHMRVRGHADEPCPRCGTRIRRTRKGDDETDYCPTCQPPPGGLPF